MRVKVKNEKSDKSVEWLKYEFINHAANNCTVALMWEYMVIPFKISVNVEDIVINTLRDQIKGPIGFNPLYVISAAQYCMNANKNLDEAYDWSKKAVTGFGGQKIYPTISNLVNACLKTNKMKEADSLMTDVVALGNATQLTAFGRNLITAKQADRALKLFQENQKRNGDNFNTNSGLMRGYSAKGDFAKALEYANKTLAQAPEPQKKAVEDMIAKLKESKDIN